MHVFVRAVVNGFGLSLGSALFKKVSKRIGLDDDDKSKDKTKEGSADADADEADAGEDAGAGKDADAPPSSSV